MLRTNYKLLYTVKSNKKHSKRAKAAVFLQTPFEVVCIPVTTCKKIFKTGHDVKGKQQLHLRKWQSMSSRKRWSWFGFEFAPVA